MLSPTLLRIALLAGILSSSVARFAAARCQEPATAPSEVERRVPVSRQVQEETLRAAAEKLSERVEEGRITRLSIPPLPKTVMLPLPVVHRIAGSPTPIPLSTESYEKALGAIDRGLSWLRSVQGPNGGWMEATAAAGTDQVRASNAATLAVTGLVLKAFAQRGAPLSPGAAPSHDAPPSHTAPPESDAAIVRAIDFIREGAWVDGRFEPDASGALGNYVASCITMGFAAVGSDLTREAMRETVAWLIANQWDQNDGIGPERDWFGGAGYGNGRRPDLSNTQVFLDALHDAGVAPTDPAVQKALIFVTRCQNEPQFNSAAWATDGAKDGGMVYTPANGGESMASAAAGEGRAGEKLPEGTPRSLRSYGSMTYAGFKSLLYAGLSEHDPRVRDAFDWIRNHWTFAENPGMGQEGRYYYLHAMARALAAARKPVIVDANGISHDWRVELIDAIAAVQQADGSFRNEAERWMESKPELATAYLVLALEEALKPSLTIEP